MLLYYCLHIHEHPALALALNTLVSMSHSGHLTLMEDVLQRSPGDCTIEQKYINSTHFKMIFAVAKKKDLFGMKRMQKLLVVQSAQARNPVFNS